MVWYDEFVLLSFFAYCDGIVYGLGDGMKEGGGGWKEKEGGNLMRLD